MIVKTKLFGFEIDEAAKNAHFFLPEMPEKAIPNADFWRLILDDGLRTEIPVFSRKQQGKVTETENGLLCEYEQVVSEYGDTYPIKLCIEIKKEDELLFFYPSLENNTENVRINECYCLLADFDALYGNREDDVLYYPDGLGVKIRNPWKYMEDSSGDYYNHNPYECHYNLHYPRCSMSWFGVESGDRFLYMARYDDKIRCCQLTIRQRLLQDTGNLMMGFNHFPMARPGEKLDLPVSVIGMLKGDWRQGAKLYRAYADKSFYQVIDRDPWVQEMTGWQRIVMRSQYGEDYVKPEDLPEVYRVGAQHGLHSIFLFGWWKEGLDRGYTAYNEPYDGAYDVLRENIRKVQDMGGHIILVVPGFFMDAAYPYYQEKGKDLATIDINGDVITWTMHYVGNGDFRNSYGRKHLPLACSCTQEWRDEQMRYLEKLNTMGAQCLFVDCYGTQPYEPCFNDKHEHGNRVDEEWVGHRKSFASMRDYCAREGRVFGTEMVCDIGSSYVQFVHGVDKVQFNPGSNEFPAMFRYTFPEVITTNRRLRHKHTKDFAKPFKWSLTQGLRMDAELWVCRADIGKDPMYAECVGMHSDALNRYADYILHGTYTVTDHEPLPDCIKLGEYIHKDGKKLLRAIYNMSDEPVEVFGTVLEADALRFDEIEL